VLLPCCDAMAGLFARASVLLASLRLGTRVPDPPHRLSTMPVVVNTHVWLSSALVRWHQCGRLLVSNHGPGVQVRLNPV
jgi:hypothetical protein